MNNLEKIGENLYSFKICLADTKVDSDYERFTVSALDKMADLYRGRTGFMEVQGKSYKPRISQAWVDFDYRNDYEPKLYAIAHCIINSDDVKIVDEYLDTHKEISISCSVLSRRCSICGKDNLELSWFGGYHFLEENYYVCSQCSYIRVMAYSPTLNAVCKDYCDDRWLRKAKELKVDIVGFEEYEQYVSMLPRELMDILEEARKDDVCE